MRTLVSSLSSSAIVVALAALAVVRPASAQDPEHAYWTTIDEAIAEADAGRHSEALVLFRRAHELRPSARTLRAMGLMLYEMRDYVSASSVLAEALEDTRRPLEGSERDEVAAALRRAQSFIGTLMLHARPPDIEVTIDGRLIELAAEGSLPLNPGEHELAFRAAGHVPERRTVVIRAGERLDLEVELRPEARLVPPPPAAPSIPLVVRSEQPDITLHATPVVLGAPRLAVRSEVCTAPCETRIQPGQYELGVSRGAERPILAGGFLLREASRVSLLYNDRTGWRVVGFLTIPLTIGAVIGLAAAGFSMQPNEPWLLVMATVSGVVGTVLTFTWTFLRNSVSVQVRAVHLDPAMTEPSALDDDLPRISGVPGELVAERYALEQTLGVGGMGEVFEARHSITGKKVALKWLRPELAKDESVRRRLLREAKIAARVQHPNVVDIYDVGTHRGAIFLVMELLRGQTLRQWMAARGAARPDELVALLIPALRGLAAVHAAGVVHRDLKPQNIFLCEAEDGSFREAKVLDFGIATDAASITLTELTAPGQIVGTPAYMAPEQLDGRDVDARTDVYAVGVILYEALTGRRPFDGKDLASLVRSIVLDEAPPVNDVRADLPPGLAEVVARAMSRRPEHRYPDVASLVNALAPFSSEPTSPISLSPPRRRGARVGWWAAGGLGLAALLYVTLGPLLAPVEQPEPRSEITAPPPEPTAESVIVEPEPEVALEGMDRAPEADQGAEGEAQSEELVQADGEEPARAEEDPPTSRTSARTPRPRARTETPTPEAAPRGRGRGRFSLDRSQF